jgi:SAM-dependent methyltransferase
MTLENRQSRAFFEARYQAASDPWQFGSSAYELNRYRATLAALAQKRYRRAFEPGCSVGVLTAALASRVEQLVACDISDTAVALCQERCRCFTNVEIHQGDVAAKSPEGTFDLIIFSELGYYFSAERLRTVASQLASRLDPGGEFVAVHWLGDSADHVLHGDEVHELLAHSLPGEWIKGSRHEGFRIDSWRAMP